MVGNRPWSLGGAKRRSRLGVDGWFFDRTAPKYLCELWEAEPGETVNSMADALDLGTIELAPSWMSVVHERPGGAATKGAHCGSMFPSS